LFSGVQKYNTAYMTGILQKGLILIILAWVLLFSAKKPEGSCVYPETTINQMRL